LGFHYAMEHEENVRGIAFFEAMMRSYKTWEDFPAPLRDTFRKFRTPGEGWELLIERNVFVEQLLPQSVMRRLSEREMDCYREPFRPGRGVGAGEHQEPPDGRHRTGDSLPPGGQP